CRRAVTAAEDHLVDHQPIDNPSESGMFRRASLAEIALYNGHALFNATLRAPATAPMATGQLRAALGSPSSLSRRRRAVGTTKLATLELLHGDRDEAITLAHQALDLSNGMRSARLTEDLRRLRTATTGHTGTPITTLRHQLDTALTSAPASRT
ncbi:MAG: hypothetical protein ACRD0H_25625, partial [Actinomycetes bacterium]